MHDTGIKLANKVADCCLSEYRLLPKKGKPQEGQWTVLSGFVLETDAGKIPT